MPRLVSLVGVRGETGDSILDHPYDGREHPVLRTVVGLKGDTEGPKAGVASCSRAAGSQN